MLRLSRDTGWKLAEIEAMPLSEFRLYQASYAVDPSGTEADDIRTAIVATTVARAAGDKRCKLTDFIPKWYTSKEDEWANTLAGFKAYAAGNRG